MLGQFTVLYSFVGFFSRDRALRSIQPHSQAAPWGQGTEIALHLCRIQTVLLSPPLSLPPPLPSALSLPLFLLG